VGILRVASVLCTYSNIGIRELRVIAQMQVSFMVFAGMFPVSTICIGKNPYSTFRRLFQLHFFSWDTYILHDCPSSHVSVGFPEMGRGLLMVLGRFGRV